jgi:hypothetical protein
MGSNLPGEQAAWGASCLRSNLPGEQAAWGASCLGSKLPGELAAWELAVYCLMSQVLVIELRKIARSRRQKAGAGLGY